MSRLFILGQLREYFYSSNVVVIADAGHTYPIVESEGDWFKIAVKDQQTAYVANWVVSKNNSQGTTSQNNTSQVAERKQGTLKGLTDRAGCRSWR